MRNTSRLKRILDDAMLVPIYGGDPEDDEGDLGGNGGEGGDPAENDDDDDDDGTPSPRKLADKANRRKGRKAADDDDDDEDLSHISDPKERRIAELSRENARRRRELRAAQRERDEARATLEEKEAGKQSTEQKLTKDLNKANETIAALTSQLENGLLRTSIQEFEAYKWHDVNLVMRELNKKAIFVDLEEGEVEGIQKELKRIAKEKPFLVKKAEKSKDDDADDDEKPEPKPKSGQHQRRQNATTKRQKALTDKYRMAGRI